MSEKTALVILAEFCEELEVASPVDFLRLCQVKVTVAGLTGAQQVQCARGLMMVPDCALDEVIHNNYDVIVMPGGNAGSDLIAESEVVGEMLKRQDQRGALIAGICGSPKALLKSKIGFGRRITSYPLWNKLLSKDFDYCEESVVQDGNIITARGPAQALQWSKKIAESLVDSAKVKVATDRMLFDN